MSSEAARIAPCSRSARPQKGLARRAQLGNPKPPRCKSGGVESVARTIGMCSLDARSKGQYGCIPGRNARSWLFLGSLDPQRENLQRTSESVRSWNNMN